jgi:hypothetical protein
MRTKGAFSRLTKAVAPASVMKRTSPAFAFVLTMGIGDGALSPLAESSSPCWPTTDGARPSTSFMAFAGLSFAVAFLVCYCTEVWLQRSSGKA